MDSEALFTLALLLLYLLFQVLGSRKKSPPGQPGGGAPQREEGAAEARPPQSLEEALREIRTALGGGPPPEAGPPEQQPSVPPARKIPGSREINPRLDHYGDEETFEGRPALAETKKGVSRPGRTAQTAPPVSLPEPSLGPKSGAADLHSLQTGSATAPSRQYTELQQRLRNPNTAREAVVLSEILGPPRALRRS